MPGDNILQIFLRYLSTDQVLTFPIGVLASITLVL